MKSPDLIDHSLSYHNPDPEMVKEIEKVRDAAKLFANILLIVVPDGRCKAIAQTKVEECAMWAVKGVVLEQPVTVAITDEHGESI